MKSLNCHTRRGFTLPEMVLVVAVITIMVGLIITPALQLFQTDDETQESTNLNEIQKALTAYLAAPNPNLPTANDLSTHTNEWATRLTPFTNLSMGRLTTDQWGNLRVFRAATQNVQLGSMTVSITYVAVHGSGADQQVTPAPGIAVLTDANGTTYAPNNHSDWWHRQANPRENFQNLTTAGDDHLIKVDNQQSQMAALQTTLTRMQRITTALEVQARTSYTEVVSICAARPRNASGQIPSSDAWFGICQRFKPENLIYGPRTGNVVATYDEDSNNYFTYLNARRQGLSGPDPDFEPFFGNLEQRSNEMKAIVTQLGLSEDHCCSAHSFVAYNGQTYPAPFYYFSNPRERLSYNSCGPRRVNWITGVGAVNQRKLPPRLTLELVQEAAATPDRPATCG